MAESKYSRGCTLDSSVIMRENPIAAATSAPVAATQPEPSPATPSSISSASDARSSSIRSQSLGIKDPERLVLGGKRRQSTCWFDEGPIGAFERPRIVEWGDEYASLGTPEAGRPRFLFLPFDLDIPKHLRQAPPDVVNSLRKDAAAKLARTLTALVEAASVPRAARKHGGLRDLATEPPGPHRLRAQTAHAIFLVTTTRFYPDSMLHTVCESTPLRTLLFGNDLDRVSARAKASEVHKLGLFSKDAVVATLRRAFNRELAPHCVAATAHVGALGIPLVLLIAQKGHMARQHWFYNGVCRLLQPEYVYSTRPASIPGKRSVKRMFSVLDRSPRVAACGGPVHAAWSWRKLFQVRQGFTWSSLAMAALFDSAVRLPTQSAFGLLISLDERNMAVRFNALAPAEALGPRPGSYAVAQVLAGAGRGSESWSAYDYHLHNSTSAILATNLVYPSNDVTRYSLASHCYFLDSGDEAQLSEFIAKAARTDTRQLFTTLYMLHHFGDLFHTNTLPPSKAEHGSSAGQSSSRCVGLSIQFLFEIVSLPPRFLSPSLFYALFRGAMVQTAGFNQWAEAIQMVLVCLIGVQTVFASRMQTHNTLIPVGFISIALGLASALIAYESVSMLLRSRFPLLLQLILAAEGVSLLLVAVACHVDAWLYLARGSGRPDLALQRDPKDVLRRELLKAWRPSLSGASQASEAGTGQSKGSAIVGSVIEPREQEDRCLQSDQYGYSTNLAVHILCIIPATLAALSMAGARMVQAPLYAFTNVHDVTGDGIPPVMSSDPAEQRRKEQELNAYGAIFLVFWSSCNLLVGGVVLTDVIPASAMFITLWAYVAVHITLRIVGFGWSLFIDDIVARVATRWRNRHVRRDRDLSVSSMP